MVKKKSRKKRNRYVGKLPINARITIDYTKKKPSVKFGYPRKDSFYQVILSFPTLIPAMLITIMFGYLIQYATADLLSTNDYPEMDDCQTYLTHLKNKTYLIGVHLECEMDGEIYVMKTKLVRGNGIFYFNDPPKLYNDDDAVVKDNLTFILSLIRAGLICLLFPLSLFLVYMFYTRTKLGQRIFPEFGKIISDARFYTKFDKVPGNKQIEIPLFKNIYLDYKATKGFSKNLLKMEIMEHPFTEIVRQSSSVFSLKKRSMGEITKTKKQVYLWKATFYFKDIPTDGTLEVWWT